MCSAKLSKNVIHRLESPEYNFVNEELIKISFEKRDFFDFLKTTKIDFLKLF